LEYQYGLGPDKVHEFFRSKRPWSRVKDEIVSGYIECYLKAVPNLQRRILIVDGFAGPGVFGDDSEGSPLILCGAITRRIGAQAPMSCLFADSRLGHRTALLSNLADYIRRGICEPPYEKCLDAITHALKIGAQSTLFFYLDPFGIKELEFDMLKKIAERGLLRSTEILMNFSFRQFMRMSGNWNFTDSATEISEKVKKAKKETVDRVMGGNYWQNIITNQALDKIKREDAVLEAYLHHVRELFPFAYAIPVKEKSEDQWNVPEDQLARYHLIFGTRNRLAIQLMNDVALNALAPYFSQFNEGLLFDFTPERHRPIDRERAKTAIIDAVRMHPLKRPDIYKAIVPNFFLHHHTKDYRAMIDDLVFKEGRLYPDKRTIKRKNQLNNDTLLSATPWAG
jgi:three-Cys-motif partner protein